MISYQLRNTGRTDGRAGDLSIKFDKNGAAVTEL